MFSSLSAESLRSDGNPVSVNGQGFAQGLAELGASGVADRDGSPPFRQGGDLCQLLQRSALAGAVDGFQGDEQTGVGMSFDDVHFDVPFFSLDTGSGRNNT